MAKNKPIFLNEPKLKLSKRKTEKTPLSFSVQKKEIENLKSAYFAAKNHEINNFICNLKNKQPHNLEFRRIESTIYCQACEDIKEKLIQHCEYNKKLGWYLPSDKLNLLINKMQQGIEDHG